MILFKPRLRNEIRLCKLEGFSMYTTCRAPLIMSNNEFLFYQMRHFITTISPKTLYQHKNSINFFKLSPAKLLAQQNVRPRKQEPHPHNWVQYPPLFTNTLKLPLLTPYQSRDNRPPMRTHHPGRRKRRIRHLYSCRTYTRR